LYNGLVVTAAPPISGFGVTGTVNCGVAGCTGVGVSGVGVSGVDISGVGVSGVFSGNAGVTPESLPGFAGLASGGTVIESGVLEFGIAGALELDSPGAPESGTTTGASSALRIESICNFKASRSCVIVSSCAFKSVFSLRNCSDSGRAQAVNNKSNAIDTRILFIP
jgi:hypothetical protein